MHATIINRATAGDRAVVLVRAFSPLAFVGFGGSLRFYGQRSATAEDHGGPIPGHREVTGILRRRVSFDSVALDLDRCPSGVGAFRASDSICFPADRHTHQFFAFGVVLIYLFLCARIFRFSEVADALEDQKPAVGGCLHGPFIFAMPVTFIGGGGWALIEAGERAGFVFARTKRGDESQVPGRKFGVLLIDIKVFCAFAGSASAAMCRFSRFFCFFSFGHFFFGLFPRRQFLIANPVF